jgi:hypothetical protein
VIEQSDGIVISGGLKYGPLFTDCATRNNNSFARATPALHYTAQHRTTHHHAYSTTRYDAYITVECRLQ